MHAMLLAAEMARRSKEWQQGNWEGVWGGKKGRKAAASRDRAAAGTNASGC